MARSWSMRVGTRARLPAAPFAAASRPRDGSSRAPARTSMRITGVRVDVVDMGRANAIYVRIDTDKGLTGTGETVLKRRSRTVAANLAEIGEYLVGKDALAIEDHFEKLYRDTFWLG